MKFVLSSTDLLTHLQGISRVLKSKKELPILDNYLLNIRKISETNSENYEFRFNETYKEYNFLLKLLIQDEEKLFISKYEKKKPRAFSKQNLEINIANNYLIENEAIIPTRTIDFKSYLSGSIKQLKRQLAIYTGQILSTLFRVLRNTRIHSLSIFFGLCCSRSGYIFEAITGTSSHPVPANL